MSNSTYNDLFRRFLPIVRGMLRNKNVPFAVLENRAKEVVHLTIFRVWEILSTEGGYKEEGKFKSFFMTVANNISAELYRKYKSVNLDMALPEAVDFFQLVTFNYQENLNTFIDNEETPDRLDLDVISINPSDLSDYQQHLFNLIANHFHKLTKLERNMLRFFYKDNLRIKEIAEHTNQTECNVRQTLSRARKKLKGYCGE